MREDYVEVGYVAKAHGVQGEVKISFDVHDLSDYLNRKSFWLAHKNGVEKEWEISRMRLADKHVIVKFKDIRYRDEAEQLVGMTLFVPQTDLPQLPEGEFYYFEIIGFDVVDKQLGKLGKVKDIVETGSQDIILMEYHNQEVLIPVVDQIVLSADKNQRCVYTHLPDGLLETYLEE